MHLSGLQFASYKAFEDLQEMEIRPITLLFGRNSAGKSAALRLLPILSDAAKERPQGFLPSIFDYKSPALRGARFADMVNAGKKSGIMSIGLKWPDAVYEFTVGVADPRDGEVILQFSFSQGDDSIEGVLSGDPGSRIYEVRHSGSQEPGPLVFDGLSPDPVETSRLDFHVLANELSRRLYGFSQDVVWIESIRKQPPRYFEFGPGVDTNIRPDGSGTAEALRASFLSGDGVAEAVSDWLKRASGAELSFAATDEQLVGGRVMVPFRLRVTPASDTQVAVTDLGEGISQALPVVTLCHKARLGLLGDHPILAIEQPELHLHPQATVCLADEVVSCVANGSKARHVIETHSESFLLSLQIALVQKRLKASEVVVYWVSSADGASTLRKIEFDDEGFPISGWPAGVFRETLEQARQLGKLRVDL